MTPALWFILGAIVALALVAIIIRVVLRHIEKQWERQK